jgi:putative thiamine transport system ATP-binding protein
MSLVLAGFAITAKASAAPLFAPLSLTVTREAVVTVMGASGVGKSTLLDAIAGHLARGFRLQGQVSLDGRDVTHLPAEARQIGLLFQDAVMFPHLSVGDNLGFGLPQRLHGREARRAAVAQALDQAGLGGMQDRDPATLSGGQRARAALMRALLAEPRALLLDEPFSRLDAALRAEIRQFVFDHARAQGVPVLMVTHDRADADAAGGLVVTL